MTIRTPEKESARPYLLDPNRSKQPDLSHEKYPGRIATGVTVVATGPGGCCGNYDLGQLDLDSLHRFLRSKGGRNDLAEDILKRMLGHPVGGRGD